MARNTLFITLPAILIIPTDDALSAAIAEISRSGKDGINVVGMLDAVRRHTVQLARGEQSIITALHDMQSRYVERSPLSVNGDYCRAASFLLALKELGNDVESAHRHIAVLTSTCAETAYWQTIEEQTKIWPQILQLLQWVWKHGSFVQPVADPVMRLGNPSMADSPDSPLKSTIYRHNYAPQCLGRFTRRVLARDEGMMSQAYWGDYHGLLDSAAFVGMTEYDMKAATIAGIPHRIYLHHDTAGFTPPEATHRVVSLDDIPTYLQRHGW